MTDDALEPDDRRGGPERLVTLVDAVVAIAMTLLALDLRPDLPESVSSAKLGEYFYDKQGQYVAFVLAFVIIAQYWVTHHRMMRTVTRHDTGLTWATMLFLFGITLLPLTSYLTGNFDAPLAATIFAGNLVLLSISLAVMSEVITRHDLRPVALDAVTRLRGRYREVVAIVVPLVVAVLAWFVPHTAYLFVLFFFADVPGRIATRHMRPSTVDPREVR